MLRIGCLRASRLVFPLPSMFAVLSCCIRTARRRSRPRTRRWLSSRPPKPLTPSSRLSARCSRSWMHGAASKRSRRASACVLPMLAVPPVAPVRTAPASWEEQAPPVLSCRPATRSVALQAMTTTANVCQWRWRWRGATSRLGKWHYRVVALSPPLHIALRMLVFVVVSPSICRCITVHLLLYHRPFTARWRCWKCFGRRRRCRVKPICSHAPCGRCVGHAIVVAAPCQRVTLT